MTTEQKEEASKVADQLKQIAESGIDTEMQHVNADKLLCEFLITLGYQSVVDAYRQVPKWYA